MDRKLDELLHALMQNMTIAVSGEKLARDLGISHSMLARWIDKLRSYGLEIRGELFTGYRMTRRRLQSRIEILVAFLEEFEQLRKKFEEAGPQSIIDQWTETSSFANGRRLQIDDGVRVIEGISRGL